MHHKYIECECQDLQHLVRLSYFKDEPYLLYVEFHLQSKPWYKRIVSGLRYIFGYKSKYGEFGEVLWSVPTVKEAVQFGNQFLKDYHELSQPVIPKLSEEAREQIKRADRVRNEIATKAKDIVLG